MEHSWYEFGKLCQCGAPSVPPPAGCQSRLIYACAACWERARADRTAERMSMPVSELDRTYICDILGKAMGEK